MPVFVKHELIKPETVESRLYQEVLAARVIDKGNSLVVAPTALGKTIVAAMVSAKRLKDFPEKKVLIVSPTKPLAVQHQKSFQKVMNLKENEIQLLTGSVQKSKREALWNNAKIISATPQAIENDLMQAKISFKEVSLLVFDEAHRAIGDYAYVFLAQQYMKQALQPLILALTASPGGEEEKIKDVCRNLFIENVEIKTEHDEDVSPYVNEIQMDWIKVDLPPSFLEIKQLLNSFVKEQLSFLRTTGVSRSISPTFYKKKDLLILQSQIRRQLVSGQVKNPAMWTAISRIAAILKVSHAQILLETQGIEALEDYFNRLKNKSSKSGAPKALKFILAHDLVIKAMHLSNKLFEQKVPHPKIIKLKEVLQKQFLEHPESRVLVFNHYRDSAKFLQKYLNQFDGIKAKKFVGQAMKENDEGMSQKAQIKTLEEFKEGKYNTLICTSVAEEGLDIPAVDLVIFFEAVPSEIRAIQRRGRTGRLSKGKAIVLMARNTRDEAFYYAAQGKERKMHRTLHSLKKEMGSLKMPQQTTLHKFNEEAKEKVLIYVDTREQASQVVTELQKRGDVFIKVKQLDIGDFVLGEQVCVERKTVEDFLQSLIDGRLFNQLISLAANYERPLIILEGDSQELYSLRNIHPNAIKGALSSIALNYRIPMLSTKNLEETVEWLYLIAKREQLGKDKDIRLRVGRKSLTEKELQQFIVESLPSVGPTLAKNLLKHFGSVKKVFSSTEKQLLKVEKIGEKKAKEIRKIIEAEFSDEEKK